LELIRHIRARRDIPGIAISGYATDEDVRQSLQAGFAIHLAKPITFATLESAIRQVTAA
jgi:CheY-like chemotaxis protein